MQDKTYIFHTRLSAEVAIARLIDLLTKAEVQYKIEGLSVSSTRIPIALFRFQSAFYSGRNWTGMNPFPYISGINVRCQAGKSGLTEVTARVNRGRAFVYLMSQFCICGLASAAAPKLAYAILFVSFSLAITWFGLSFLSGDLLRKEITNCLNE